MNEMQTITILVLAGLYFGRLKWWPGLIVSQVLLVLWLLVAGAFS